VRPPYPNVITSFFEFLQLLGCETVIKIDHPVKPGEYGSYYIQATIAQFIWAIHDPKLRNPYGANDFTQSLVTLFCRAPTPLRTIFNLRP